MLQPLQDTGWAVLHDLRWPGRPFANIDHIAVGPTGVFVIDSKNWTGDVVVRGGILRQNGYRRTDECASVVSAAGAVAAFLEPQHRSLVLGLLCLVAHPTPADQPAGSRVVGLADLTGTLTTGPARLSPTDVLAIAHYLRRLLDGSRSPEQTTTSALATATRAPVVPHRRPRRGQRSAPAARPSSPGRMRRPRRSGRHVMGNLVKLGLALLLALVVAPAWLNRLATATDGPGNTQPSVQQPTASPQPAVRKKSGSTKSPSAPNPVSRP